MESNLLELKDVSVHFPIKQGLVFQKHLGHVKAVDSVSLTVGQNEIVGLVGESGCGKTTLGRTIMRLIAYNSGHILFQNQDLAKMPAKKLHRLRPSFQMIFQDPYASHNPRMTVYQAIAEPLLTHHVVPKKEIGKEVTRLMRLVGLAPRFISKYPHEFSGGQRQRIAIARALALRPKLIIADEPVSALDVSIQAQIINILSELTRTLDLTMIFISHDLSVVKHICDRIADMYLGKIVEIGSADDVFNHPRHPYTQALVSAIPLPDPQKEKSRRHVPVLGEPPSPMNPPVGCTFHPRCPLATAECKLDFPSFTRVGEHHHVACINLPTPQS